MTSRSNAAVSKIYILFNYCILEKTKIRIKGKDEYVWIFLDFLHFITYTYIEKKHSKNILKLFRMTRKKECFKKQLLLRRLHTPDAV